MKIMNIINKIKNSKKLRALIVIKLLVKIIFIFSVLINTSCGEKALLWEMSTDRLEVMLKGTYESEPGYIWPWQWTTTGTPNGPNSNGLVSNVEDDSIVYKGGDAPGVGISVTNDTLPTQFMFDIAEMRIVDTEGTELKFANFRQTYTIGLNDTDSFFTNGILLQTDDVTPGKTYTTLKIYLRKTVFNNATQYTSSDGGSSWSYVSTTSTMFAETTVNGYDFTSSMMNTYWDSLRMEALYVNRIFPLEIPISGGFQYSLADGRTILEVRLLIKNFIKKYETVTYPDGVMTLTHFWGFSDQLRNVKQNESYYGGNLLGVARSYVPATSRTLEVTGTVAGRYIILVPSGAANSEYFMAAAYDFRNDKVPNCDFPKPPINPGNYIGPLMDYYLNYEKYKINYSNVYTACTPITNFQTEWDAYNSAVSNFKLPVAAIYTTGGLNYIRNIKPGEYDVYRLDPPVYGKIFGEQTITSRGTAHLTGGDDSIAY